MDASLYADNYLALAKICRPTYLPDRPNYLSIDTSFHPHGRLCGYSFVLHKENFSRYPALFANPTCFPTDSQAESRHVTYLGIEHQVYYVVWLLLAGVIIHCLLRYGGT